MLSPNMEDYLEVIFRLSEGSGRARVSEIAGAVRVRKASVSKALRRLAATGYVEHDPYGDVALTETGGRVARHQVRAHCTLTRFLCEVLFLPSEEADREACRIEHTVGPMTVDRMEGFLEYTGRAPRAHRRWLEQFARVARRLEAADPGGGSAAGARRDSLARDGRFVERERAWISTV